jgi:hypothetical protein
MLVRPPLAGKARDFGLLEDDHQNLIKILPNCRSGAVDNIWNKFGVKPPDQTFQLTSSSRNDVPFFNKYAQLKNKIDMQKKTLQQLMQRGAMEIATTPEVILL